MDMSLFGTVSVQTVLQAQTALRILTGLNVPIANDRIIDTLWGIQQDTKEYLNQRGGGRVNTA